MLDHELLGTNTWKCSSRAFLENQCGCFTTSAAHVFTNSRVSLSQYLVRVEGNRSIGVTLFPISFEDCPIWTKSSIAEISEVPLSYDGCSESILLVLPKE
jgi:hypothetical protein